MRDLVIDTGREMGKRARQARHYPKHKENKYLNRKFVAVDGEGINVRSGKRKGAHDYVLLAISGEKPILRRDGLHTFEILDYLWSNLDPRNLNVIYGGSYDFNCWLADFPQAVVERIYGAGKRGRGFTYAGYTVKWMKGKSFSIKKAGKTVVIYDVISFFQKSFVDACDEYLGKDWPGRETIIREKKRRGNFTWREIKSIANYNDYELETLVELCTELRSRLNGAGLRPKSWIGPGAIASALFVREGVREHMSREIPPEVAAAGRYAYAGGRFECLQYGISRNPAYEYDVNSAYPKALSLVPSLARGTWIHRGKGVNTSRPDEFALYRVRWRSAPNADPRLPGPLFVRAANGTIAYPMDGENWVWGPEVSNLRDYAELTGMRYTILESWRWSPASAHKPFGFVPALYERRKVLKAAGDGAHIGIKLALNSMYGKTAQQVGFDRRTMQPPAWHQLEWAGFVTSWCRATVFRAAMQDLDAVIAFETDALFTRRPLDLAVSERLGEFELTEFSSLTYVQSGHYYGTAWEKGEWREVQKSRGVDKGELNRMRTEQYFALPLFMRVQRAQLTRFVGAGIALAQSFEKWRRWETTEKNLHLWPMGKRVPLPEIPGEEWGRTICPVAGGMSSAYPVEWVNPDENMTELAERRESEYDYTIE